MINCLVCAAKVDNVLFYLINNFENIHKCHFWKLDGVHFNFDSNLIQRCGMIYCQYISLMLYFVYN